MRRRLSSSKMEILTNQLCRVSDSLAEGTNVSIVLLLVISGSLILISGVILGILEYERIKRKVKNG